MSAGPIVPPRESRERHARGVVAAAERLLFEKGPSFTIQEVAREAGVALQTLYRCFKSRDALLLAVFEDIIARQSAKYIEDESQLDPVERLRIVITAALDDVGDIANPARRFLTAEYWRLYEIFPEEMTKATLPYVEVTERLLRAAIGSGALYSDDPAQDAWLICKTVMAIYHHRAYAPADPAAALAKERFWQFCLAALRNPERG